MNQDWNIPSFFKHSEVKPKYVFNENELNTSENILTDYDTPNYVRIMKNFATPDFNAEDQMEESLKSNSTQKAFFLRCYLPKKSIIQENPENRVKDVVIMINGLSETKRFDFYDQLGSYFASQNIASILMPTPYHLNRRNVKVIEQANRNNSNVIDPLMLAKDNPLLFYYNFKRSIHEVENLCDRIHGDIVDDDDMGFYDAYFARGNGIKVRVSLFGFSLGGLRALGCFMKENQDKKENPRYHSCIAFNSTADPFAAAVEKFRLIDAKDWNDIRNKVNEAINTNQIATNSNDSRMILRIFKWLYNRNNDISLVEALKRVSKKFLMVQSAADRIVEEGSEWNITDPKHGLNRIVVAGVDHVVMTDKVWHQYLATVSEQLIMFIRNANDTSYSHIEIENRIREIIAPTSVYKNIEGNYPFKEDIEAMNFSNQLFNAFTQQLPFEEKKKFIELYYQSKGFYPKFSELLSKIMNKKERFLTFSKLQIDTELKCGPGNEYKTTHLLKQNDEVKVINMASATWLQVELLPMGTGERLIGFIECGTITNNNDKPHCLGSVAQPQGMADPCPDSSQFVTGGRALVRICHADPTAQRL